MYATLVIRRADVRFVRKEILNWLYKNQHRPVRYDDIASELDIHRNTVYHHIKALRKAQMVFGTPEKKPGGTEYQLSPDAIAWLKSEHEQ